MQDRQYHTTSASNITSSNMEKQDVAISIRHNAALMLRTEHPYMKTQTLNKLLDAMTAGLNNGIQEQQHELEQTKARANFFMLPAELRKIIYELVLAARKPLYPWAVKQSQQRRGGLTSSAPFDGFAPTLLQTSRQVYQEALPIFWSANTFRMRLVCNSPQSMLDNLVQLPGLQDWQIPLDESGFAIVKNLSIRVKLDVGISVASVMRQAMGLGNIEYIIDEYAAAICQRTGATLEELGADQGQTANEWDRDVIMLLLTSQLSEQGIKDSAVKLKFSTCYRSW